MAVIMGVFAWGGRVAARVLRGAADVVEGIVGLIDAGLDAAGEPAAGSWAGADGDEVDPFERFRASAAARSAADSFADRSAASPDLADADAADMPDDERDDDEEDLRDDPHVEQVDEDDSRGDLEAGGDQEQGSEIEVVREDLAGDEHPGDEVEIAAATGDALDADMAEDEAGDEPGDEPSSAPRGTDDTHARPTTPAADGLDRSASTTSAAGLPPADATREESLDSRPVSTATSFGEAFRSRGSLAPDPERGRILPSEQDSAPRPGTRARIAEALDAARSTFESARARRAFGAGAASGAAPGGETMRETRKGSAKSRKKKLAEADAKSGRKSKKKARSKKFGETAGGDAKPRKSPAGKATLPARKSSAKKKAKASERERPEGAARKSGRKK